jgi:hypothetical protein
LQHVTHAPATPWDWRAAIVPEAIVMQNRSLRNFEIRRQMDPKVILAALWASTWPAMSSDLPLNPAVTQETIATTIFLAHGWEDLPVIGWLRRRAAYRALIESDAKVLIERFGEAAYSEARFRQHDAPDVVDANRPAGHWEWVKEAIRRIVAGR